MRTRATLVFIVAASSLWLSSCSPRIDIVARVANHRFPIAIAQLAGQCGKETGASLKVPTAPAKESGATREIGWYFPGTPRAKDSKAVSLETLNSTGYVTAPTFYVGYVTTANLEYARIK